MPLFRTENVTILLISVWLVICPVVQSGQFYNRQHRNNYNDKRPARPPTYSWNSATTTTATSLQESQSSYTYRHKEMLNEDRGDTLEWEVDWNSKSITFTISLQTSGYVAFGLEKKGWVAGADVVVGGVRPNGETYVIDMHGVDNRTIIQDTKQDWRLISVQAFGERTVLTVSRDFDTCDPYEDLVINDDMLYIMWDYGDDIYPSYEIPSEFIPRGHIHEYLLDPETTPAETDIKTWKVSRKFCVPNRHTTYWCTIQRGPPLKEKHHLIGFAPYYPDEFTRSYIHHQIVHRCIPPPGINASSIFEKFVNHPGEECYLEEHHQLPTIFCIEMLHIWTVGGKPFQFPNNVGIPLEEDEYFMYEVHYNREDHEIDQEFIFETGVDFRYTSQLRPEEGTLFLTGHSVFGTFTVPPQETDFRVVGHCSSECVREVTPPSGMEIVATVLHSHTTTHKVRTKLTRGNKELPWVISDDNYEFDYQQFRLLREPVTVLPGDQISTECVMDTTGRNVTSTAGFASRDEMCGSFILVNKRIPLFYCFTEVPVEWYMTTYGIRNMTWNHNLYERVVNSADDPSIVGLTLATVIHLREEWTPERRREVEHDQIFGPQAVSCVNNEKAVRGANTALLLEGITNGLIPAEIDGPSSRSVGTPQILFNRTFPAPAFPYIQPSVCLA